MSGHLHIMINPVSGVLDAASVRDAALPVFRDAGYETTLYQPESAAAAAAMVAGLPALDGHALCVIGGDGTLNLAINAMMSRPESERLPVGVLPAGTGNALMTDRALLDPLAAARQIVSNSSMALDLMEVTCDGVTRYAFNLVAFGLMVSANARAEKLRMFGKRRYDIAAAWDILFHRHYPASLCIDDGDSVESDYTFIAGLNTIHAGAGMKMAPRADLCDGLIDLLVVRGISRRRLLAMLPKIYSGGHTDFPELEYVQTRSFRIESAEPQSLNVDGEIWGQTPLSVSVLPGALKLL